ncbi:unnamed protein product [Protopolystoma xenopodis]|uniref:Uncharacterized protein n=1 Tax=Protopolystoma xenopodis TaxID=117903 RepID=A0A448WTU1_9PLAT|nr:unnamed protein product [Protopolystoma xenopodis]
MVMKVGCSGPMSVGCQRSNSARQHFSVGGWPLDVYIPLLFLSLLLLPMQVRAHPVLQGLGRPGLDCFIRFTAGE